MLEKGEYHFYVGTSVRDTVEDNFVMVLEEDVVTEQLSSKVAPSMLDKRMLSDGTYETLPSGEPVDTDANALGRMSIEQMDGFAPSAVPHAGGHCWRTDGTTRFFGEVAEGICSMEEFMAQLSDKQLCDLLGGQPNLGVANTFGFGNLPEFGVPSIMTADGPAGLRIKPECGCLYDSFPLCDNAGMYLESGNCGKGRCSRRCRGKGK